jgi:hypothetical protein
MIYYYLLEGMWLLLGFIWENVWEFGQISGLKANALKSNMYMAGVGEEDMAEMLRTTGFPHGSMPFRYLRVPIAAERLKIVHFPDLLEGIKSSIEAWSQKSLSYVGRVQLIKSVVQGVECFWLSILPIPSAILDKLMSLYPGFLWGKNNFLVAWKKLALPLDEGGLGIRDLSTWNITLLSKLLWKIQAKKDNLWVKWINIMYLRGKDIWETSKRKDDSPLWKRLLDIRCDTPSRSDPLSRGNVVISHACVILVPIFYLLLFV